MQSKGYLLGRLLAVLGREGVLVTTPERAYELACVYPAQVIVPAITRLIVKKQGDSIEGIMEKLHVDAFKGALVAKEQADFALGYHHERSGKTSAPSLADDESELTERFEVRLDDSLKQWMLANGGGALIRSLLRAERARRG